MTLPRIGVQGSLTARTYEALKEAIVSQRLQPNQPLYEEQLAEQPGVSRTPLRGWRQNAALPRTFRIRTWHSSTTWSPARRKP